MDHPLFLKDFIGDNGGRLLTGNIEGLMNYYSSEHLVFQLKNFMIQVSNF